MKPTLSLKVETTSDSAHLLPHLYLSSAQVASDREWMKNSGITHVINCTRQAPAFPDDFEYMWLQVSDRDSEASTLSSHLTSCFKFIDAAQSRGSSCLIHCSAGISRSATVAIAYIMYKKKYSLLKAFSYVKDLRPVVSPNAGFMELLTDIEKTVLGFSSLCLAAYVADRYSSPESLRLNQLAPQAAQLRGKHSSFFS